MKPHGPFARVAIGVVSLTSLAIAPIRSAEAFGFPRRRAVWSGPRLVVVLPAGATPLRFGDGSYYYSTTASTTRVATR